MNEVIEINHLGTFWRALFRMLKLFFCTVSHKANENSQILSNFGTFLGNMNLSLKKLF